MMTALWLAALLVSTWGLSGSLRQAVASTALRGVLALTVAALLGSGLFIVGRMAGVPYGAVLAVHVVLAGLLAWRGRRVVSWPRILVAPDGPVLLLALAALALVFAFTLHAHRWGDWDAWCIWNLHARFLADDAHWTNVFHRGLSWSHRDYPLLLPGLIAPWWRAAGQAQVLVPVVLSFVVLAGIVTALGAALGRTAGAWAAAAAVAVIGFDQAFVQQAATQYADSLLAFFILLIALLLSDASLVQGRLRWCLLGLFASAAAFTKNEGTVVMLLVGAAAVVLERHRPRHLGLLVAGALPFVLVLLWFKLAYAPPSAMARADRSTLMELPILLERFTLILSHYPRTLLKHLPFFLPLAALLVVLRPQGAVRVVALMLLLLLAVYTVVYLFTPYDLQWHLDSSAKRLFHHVHPALVLLAVRTAGERLRGANGAPA